MNDTQQYAVSGVYIKDKRDGFNIQCVLRFYEAQSADEAVGVLIREMSEILPEHHLHVRPCVVPVPAPKEAPPSEAKEKEGDGKSGLKEFFDALGDTPFVFWVCPNGCRGMVEWDKECKVATCKECGRKSTDPPAPKEAPLSRGRGEGDGE